MGRRPHSPDSKTNNTLHYKLAVEIFFGIPLLQGGLPWLDRGSWRSRLEWKIPSPPSVLHRWVGRQRRADCERQSRSRSRAWCSTWSWRRTQTLLHRIWWGLDAEASAYSSHENERVKRLRGESTRRSVLFETVGSHSDLRCSEVQPANQGVQAHRTSPATV